MSDVRQHAEDIHEQFSEHLDDVSVDDVEGRLNNLVNEFKVPMDEAVRSVRSHYLDKAGIDRDEVASGGGSEQMLLNDIDQDEQWLDVEAKVTQLWEPRSDAVGQVGLLGDESGTMKFIAFTTSELEELEEGASYRLTNVVSDEYEGNFSVKLNRTTGIEKLDHEVEVGDDSTTVEGALVDIQSGSGLIKRCPEEDCTRVLQNGRCAEHGEGDGEFDLRIKAVIDDGMDAHEVIFNKEATEDVAEISLDEAKQMAMDALDTTVVADEIREKIMGTYYRVSGPTFGRYVLVDDLEELTDSPSGEAALIRARSM
ncbi:replication factor A [Haloarchaeobius sp. DFWS5]|uniref:replication factor A n=1 Tax=Haloarchaeobius sp. DFWS5 TaxID=3446114 RepID=UPI003EBA2A35